MKRFKRLIGTLLTFIMLVTAAAPAVFADEVTDSEYETSIEAEVTADDEGMASSIAMEDDVITDDVIIEEDISAQAYTDLATVNVHATRDYTKAYEVLDLLNEYRVSQGLGRLTMDVNLLEDAMVRAAETVVYWDHTRPDGTTCFTINSTMRAENIAWNQRSASQVMTSWKNSSGHNRNMLGSGYNSIGIGVVSYNGQMFWVQCFSPSAGTAAARRSGTVSSNDTVTYSASFVGGVRTDGPYTLSVGNTRAIRLTVGDYSTTDLTGYAVLINPSNNICTLNSSNNLVAVGGGTASITIRSGSMTVCSTSVTVNGPTKAPPTNTPTATNTPTPTAPPSVQQLSSDEGASQFVERLYTVVLGRASEEAGKASWVNSITGGSTTGGDAARFFLLSDEFTNRNLGNSDFVRILYRLFFDREADSSGLNYWVNQLNNNGGNRSAIIREFINTTEWANICLTYGIKSGGAGTPSITVWASPDIVAFVTRLYTTCLGRDAEASGLEYWSLALANRHASGSEAASVFFLGTEFTNHNYSNADYVTRLYRTFMNREPDAAGLNYWVNQLLGGKTRSFVFRAFTESGEWVSICNRCGIIP